MIEKTLDKGGKYQESDLRHISLKMHINIQQEHSPRQIEFRGETKV